MSYDMIDRFLRNKLDDDDYAEYSAALDSLCAPQQRTWVELTSEDYNKIFKQARTGEHAVQLAAAMLKEKNDCPN